MENWKKGEMWTNTSYHFMITEWVCKKGDKGLLKKNKSWQPFEREMVFTTCRLNLNNFNSLKPSFIKLLSNNFLSPYLKFAINLAL